MCCLVFVRSLLLFFVVVVVVVVATRAVCCFVFLKQHKLCQSIFCRLIKMIYFFNSNHKTYFKKYLRFCKLKGTVNANAGGHLKGPMLHSVSVLLYFLFSSFKSSSGS